MTDRDATAIAEYVKANPDGKRSPAGWVYTLLRANPRWRPPERRGLTRGSTVAEDLVAIRAAGARLASDDDEDG